MVLSILKKKYLRMINSDVFATTDRYQYSGMKEPQKNNKSEINRKQFNNARKEYWKNEYPEKQTK